MSSSFHDDDDIDNNPFAEPAESGPAETSKVADEPIGEIVGNGEVKKPTEETDKAAEAPKKNVLPERSSNQKFNITVKVTGLERAGSTNNKKENPTIVLDLNTNLPTFRKQTHKKVKKTMEEFQQLFKYLNGAIQESFIPALPIPFTNYGINNREDLDKTVHNFQLWFDRILSDPLILRNEELAFFIESDHNTYSPINKSTLPATGLKRKTLKQLSPPFDETLELAEFRPLVKSIHWTAKDLQLKLLRVSKAKKIVAENENAMGKGFISLSDYYKKFNDETVSSKQITLYKHFGKIITTVGDFDSIIATVDIATFYDGLEWIINDTYVVKEALTNRHLIMRELIQAQQNTKSKQDNARRLRAKRDINPIKVDEAIRQLKEATRYEQQLTLKLERVTTNMLLERKEWLNWYEEHLKSIIKEYTLKRIEYERKKLSILEKVRSDVRNADVEGGLSRLGRSHIKNKPSLNSQTINGDDWTGDVRSRDENEINQMSHTEFDESIKADEHEQEHGSDAGNNSITTESSTSSSTPPSASILDAKNAASMLGKCTF
ncbi:hypothetical protein Kpol_440p7 [Vanderwaltozyma polyspora DSM 70294]|uniref:Vacuolar protein sorting-associated protein 17 n=1 Tax=Vanderwaltozyma polyspora (strain ATCC 22028 / DSM 70294 / BCRC 21397 / CBS 2163 / NBRC 10782 / NRRL Y-8283 / UCD 57-17) TaxID=436907 RepID=A7TRE6_VANPO|nr:uncharacterized protein Kpol_440p7 [Vanderwaltozyma polyspora DSM 70294]EDO15160.1 hypothetical protein Kpol_440p7 [Vanderwaltozyma polyspora DSM 70294]